MTLENKDAVAPEDLPPLPERLERLKGTLGLKFLKMFEEYGCSVKDALAKTEKSVMLTSVEKDGRGE